MRASRSAPASSASVDASTAPSPSTRTAASTCDEISVRSARAAGGVHDPDDTAAVRRPLAQPVAKFFADRGTHLAAMIAYFGLLSSVSLIFLALAAARLAGPGRRVELPRRRAAAPLSVAVDREHRQGRPGDQGQRDDARRDRRRSSSGRRSRSSACSSRRSTSSTAGRTAPSCAASRWRRCSWPARSSCSSTGLVLGSFGYDLLQRFARGVIANAVVAYGSRCSSRRSPSSSSSCSPTSG